MDIGGEAYFKATRTPKKLAVWKEFYEAIHMGANGISLMLLDDIRLIELETTTKTFLFTADRARELSDAFFELEGMEARPLTDRLYLYADLLDDHRKAVA
ncbi:MAG: hypothetical protein QM488_12745 [Rhizobiaceae bacterium]